ncbi:UNVERIFIED_CONTAM: hypothetical protein GTU68_061594 [Idotea baltica]|nr:hypothetical protein [Idotea baltica]
MRTAKLSRDFQELKAAVGTPLPARSVSVAEHNASWQKQISKIAVSDSTLLLTGESGTGKSTLARTVHQQGPRASHPFVTVNCAALPRDLIEDELFGHCYGALTGAVSDRPGRTEIADGGTLFLDEVGDLPLELQPKLLKFLQERSSQRIGCNKVRQVDVRVIAATHQNLAEMCTKNRFREDLFYRLSVLQMFSKPLRERPQEIDRFATTILARIAHRSGKQPNRLTPDAASQLRGCHWPGNIRQLENVLEQACVIAGGSPIGVDDLELEDSGFVYLQTTNDPNGSLAGLTLSEIEVRAIVDTLSFCAGNKAKTARQLGISEKSIYNKMRRHGLRN